MVFGERQIDFSVVSSSIPGDKFTHQSYLNIFTLFYKINVWNCNISYFYLLKTI